MLAEIAEIKVLRKRHNLTQSQLAKLAGVSQSLIAKLESGMIDPSYTNFRKIYDVLTGLKEEREAKAEEVMSKRIIDRPGCAGFNVVVAFSQVEGHNPRAVVRAEVKNITEPPHQTPTAFDFHHLPPSGRLIAAMYIPQPRLIVNLHNKKDTPDAEHLFLTLRTL